jgi:hypothetical protein
MKLLIASEEDNLHILNQLVDSYREEALQYRATLDVIRGRLDWLCRQPWAPSESALRSAMEPGERAIQLRIAAIKQREGRYGVDDVSLSRTDARGEERPEQGDNEDPEGLKED